MKSFPIQILKPQKGTLNALVFENNFINLPQSLFFQIEIALEQMVLEEENINSSFRLDFIRFDIDKLKDLENKTFTFPLNPENGYIDGSIYLFDTHNIVDVTSISFGEFKNQKIPAHFTLRIDFELEGTDYATTDYFNLEADLALGEVVIASDILTPTTENLAKAKALTEQYIGVEDFEEPYLGELGIALKMKVV